LQSYAGQVVPSARCGIGSSLRTPSALAQPTELHVVYAATPVVADSFSKSWRIKWCQHTCVLAREPLRD
jgi:hypothetical protein